MTQGIEIDEQIDKKEMAAENARVVTVEDRHQKLIKVELFNEKNGSVSHRFDLPCSYTAVKVLSGSGEARLDGNGIVATIEEPFGYLFVKLR